MSNTMKAVFCPRCKSPDIMPYLGGMSGTFQCKNCGYLGSLFIEKSLFPQVSTKKK